MFARIDSPATFEVEVQNALRLPSVAQFLAAPTINFDINTHFKFFVLLEIGDKLNEIRQACGRVDYPALLARIPQARSIFELACYQELFMAGKVYQKVLKLDPSSPKADARTLLVFYDAFVGAYGKMVAKDPSVETEVDSLATHSVLPATAFRPLDSHPANQTGRALSQSGPTIGIGVVP